MYISVPISYNEDGAVTLQEEAHLSRTLRRWSPEQATYCRNIDMVRELDEQKNFWFYAECWTNLCVLVLLLIIKKILFLYISLFCHLCWWLQVNVIYGFYFEILTYTPLNGAKLRVIKLFFFKIFY